MDCIEDLTNNFNKCEIDSYNDTLLENYLNKDEEIDEDYNVSDNTSTSYMDLTTMNISYPVAVPTQCSMKNLKVSHILPHIHITNDNLPQYNMQILLGQFLLFDYDIDMMAIFLKSYEYNDIDSYELSKFFYYWCQINL
jgi:hypothetical protein